MVIALRWWEQESRVIYLSSLNLSDPTSIVQILAQATFDDNNVPNSVTFTTSSQSVTVPPIQFPNDNQYYFQANLNATSYVDISATGGQETSAESFVLYILRECDGGIHGRRIHSPRAQR